MSSASKQSLTFITFTQSQCLRKLQHSSFCHADTLLASCLRTNQLCKTHIFHVMVSQLTSSLSNERIALQIQELLLQTKKTPCGVRKKVCSYLECAIILILCFGIVCQRYINLCVTQRSSYKEKCSNGTNILNLWGMTFLTKGHHQMKNLLQNSGNIINCHWNILWFLKTHPKKYFNVHNLLTNQQRQTLQIYNTVQKHHPQLSLTTTITTALSLTL